MADPRHLVRRSVLDCVVRGARPHRRPMTRTGPILTALLAMLMLAAAACGGGDSDSDSGATAPAATTSDPPATNLAPDELVGTWTTKLEEGDVPAPAPPELVDGGPSWVIRIGNTGGPDDGPFLAIDSADENFGNLEAPALEVEGDRLRLLEEECAAGGEQNFYDNEYQWAITGGQLTITTVTNQCPDLVAETILTSRAWTRTQ